MKRLLNLLFAVLFTSSMMAGSYTISFKDGGGDSDKSTSLTSTTVADYVAEGAEYVSAIAPAGKVYLAKAGAGLKFGNSSNGGSVTLTLATSVKPTSIVVNASQYGDSEGTGIFQGQNFDMTGGGGKYSFNDYTVNYDGETEVTTISVGTEKRGYVKSITVNFEGEGGSEGGGEGGETPVEKELKAIEASTAWDFSKITANAENEYYSNNGIKLTDESTPSKNDEVVYTNYTTDFMTIGEDFDGEAMAFKGEYPIRKNKYCQNGTLHFKTTVPGNIVVKFSDTGSSASATAVKRYLVVNGVQTEYWTSRENNGDEPYAAQLDVTTGKIAVPAGDVTITGSSAIIVYTVTFTAVDPSVLFEGEHAVSWDTPLNLEKEKFANAKGGDKIVVTYKDASDGIEFKVMNEAFSHMPGSREAAFISGEGSFEQFLTPAAVEGIKEYGLQIIGNNFKATKVELLDGKELKKGETVWTGYFWADNWNTLELYKEGYSNLDLSNYDAIRFYTQAEGTEYTLNFLSGWDEGEKFADQNNMTDGEGYKELALTDELRTKMAAADHWLVQFNKEGLPAFNVTDVVLVKLLADPTNCAEAAEAALSVENNDDLYNDGKEYTIEGYVTAIQTAYNDTHHNISFWMADAADGGNVLQAYRAVCETADNAPAVGDKVSVTGKLTKYNTTPEFAAGCTFVITEKAAEPQDLGEKTIAEFLELKNTKDICTLKGTVSNITNTLYGNFDLTDATASVYVYGLLTAEGESKKFETLGIEEGDILTIKAVYGEYNGTPQIKNAVFVSVEKAPAPVEEHTYTVAGTVIFGDEWKPETVDNDMTKQEDGTYKWEKTEITLENVTKIEFKVCEDHAWQIAYPSSNYELPIAENGVYTVTITFNPETKAVDAVATKTADIVPEGIESVGADSKAGKTVKVLRNGQLLIQKDGRTYTAQGQLLK